MRLQLFRALLTTVLACSICAVSIAEDRLASAYDAILRGDYDAARAAVTSLRDSNTPPEKVAQVELWLKGFGDMSASREELRSKTFDWNVQHSKDCLSQAERIASGAEGAELSESERALSVARRVYLALSFAAQAHWYSKDKVAFAREPWIQDLRKQAMARAEWWSKQEKWTKAAAYYTLLERVDESDAEAKKLREQVARYARLEILYKDAKEIDRRLASVDYSALDQAVRVINDYYYKKADFKKMAEAALDSLVAICRTTKLYDASKLLSGIAAAPTREHFLSRIEELRKKVAEDNSFDHSDLLKLFSSVRRLNKESIAVPESLLVVEFAEGALSALDQFTSIIWPADSIDFDKQMMGHFSGVGIQLGSDEATGRLKAATALENSPALEAGIEPDDLIMEVNGESTKGWTADQAIRKITGEEGTPVKLTMFRPATGETIDFNLNRRTIVIKTVKGVNRLEGDSSGRWNYMVDRDAGIAYVKLSNFTAESNTELHAAIESAQKQGMKGLILDLRYNPGGLLDVAVATVSEFVARGDVVSTRGRADETERLSVNGDADFADLPLVVLVNDNSASASEILSGALQDHRRAAILGERTFGKGSVQKVLTLDRSIWRSSENPPARLKLTTALYYLPNGRSPHRQPEAKVWGVDPNWEIELTPKEITKVLERERRAGIIHNEKKSVASVDADAQKKRAESMKSDASSTTDADDEERADDDLLTKADIELLRSDPIVAPDADPQLDAAILQLRTKLAAGRPWPLQFAKRPVAGDAKP